MLSAPAVRRALKALKVVVFLGFFLDEETNFLDGVKHASNEPKTWFLDVDRPSEKLVRNNLHISY